MWENSSKTSSGCYDWCNQNEIIAALEMIYILEIAGIPLELTNSSAQSNKTTAPKWWIWRDYGPMCDYQEREKSIGIQCRKGTTICLQRCNFFIFFCGISRENFLMIFIQFQNESVRMVGDPWDRVGLLVGWNIILLIRLSCPAIKSIANDLIIHLFMGVCVCHCIYCSRECARLKYTWNGFNMAMPSL